MRRGRLGLLAVSVPSLAAGLAAGVYLAPRLNISALQVFRTERSPFFSDPFYVELLRDSPADRGGLQPGDVVVEVDGRAVENAAQLRNELARAEMGSLLRLAVRRDGRWRELRVRVEETDPGA